ncbi:MAG: hypothetical protein CMN14_03730 [Roseobacter sp.]|nr:hypothetical protein [Roseobacter sp.]
MPRKRMPAKVAEMTGDTIKHPERHKGRAAPPVTPLGRAPARLSKDERAEWEAFRADMPWLCRSDRHVVEIAARMSVRIREKDCPLGIFAQLRLCLSSMGATPTDRSRVKWAEDESYDPASEFIN